MKISPPHHLRMKRRMRRKRARRSWSKSKDLALANKNYLYIGKTICTKLFANENHLYIHLCTAKVVFAGGKCVFSSSYRTISIKEYRRVWYCTFDYWMVFNITIVQYVLLNFIWRGSFPQEWRRMAGGTQGKRMTTKSKRGTVITMMMMTMM